MACLDETAALSMLDGRVADQRALEAHLDECEWCRRLVAEIARGTQPSAGVDELDVLARGTAVGRFVIEHELGRGAMGVVYAAYDPDLDREVALKLVQLSAGDDDQEARTMASLAHPNVVPVYEIGRHDGVRFIAMERIVGATLREWLAERARTSDEIVAVLAGAGEGLAAAHAAGLVHRDVKPENVLVGDDGRARVTDFGLAAPPAVVGAIVGTPAYMAPEQLAGGAVDARSDQYSFCVVAYEALTGERPVARAPALRPRHIGRAIARGLAADPDARFVSMAALLAELRPVRRRPLIVAGVALVVGATLGAVAFGARGDAPSVCGGGVDELAPVWNSARRAALETAFARDAHTRDAFARTAIELDRYSLAWITQHHASCAATRIRGEASEAVLDRRMACLGERRDELRALIDVLVERSDAFEHAPTAVATLVAPSTCAQAQPNVDPPNAEAPSLHAQLDRGNALAKLGRYADARALLEPIVQHAQALPRLRAQALYGRAVAELAERDDRAAAAALEDAAYAAQAAKSDDLAARAGSLRIVALADAGDIAAAREWMRYADAAVARVTDGDMPAEHAAHVAWLELKAGDFAAAETAARRAVATGCRGAAWRTAHCAHLDVLATALFSAGKYRDALPVYREDLDLIAAESGPDHPDTARALERVANTLDKLGQHRDALALYERALAIEEPRSDDQGRLASLLVNSGTALMELGRDHDAELRMRRALAIHERLQGADHPEVGITLVDLGNVLEREGQGAAATALRERALVILEAKLGAKHPLVAATLVQIARQRVVDHHPQDAIALLERALAIHIDAYTLSVLGSAQLDAKQPARAVVTLERALAETPADPDISFNLADALWQTGGDHARARSLATAALAATHDAEIQHWLDHHR